MNESTSPLRVVLVDDEPLGRATLRGLLTADPDVQLVAECKNGAEAVAALREHRPDAVFLDVQMPGMTGFDVVETLERDELPIVVFVTAYDQYALRAFDVNAVDYLLKPFDDERFAETLLRVKTRAREAALAERGAPASDAIEMLSLDDDGKRRKISIRSEGRVRLVDVEDVAWIEAADQYVQIHTSDGTWLMRESMSALERELPDDRFMRIHRSAIVAVDRIRVLESVPGGGARVRLADDTWLPVSRSRAPRVRARLR